MNINLILCVLGQDQKSKGIRKPYFHPRKHWFFGVDTSFLLVSLGSFAAELDVARAYGGLNKCRVFNFIRLSSGHNKISYWNHWLIRPIFKKKLSAIITMTDIPNPSDPSQSLKRPLEEEQLEGSSSQQPILPEDSAVTKAEKIETNGRIVDSNQTSSSSEPATKKVKLDEEPLQKNDARNNERGQTLVKVE